MPVVMQHIVRTLSELRDQPLATLESYVRPMRAEGVLPATKRGFGGVGVPTTAAAHLLFAVMRGSPTKAAENAREVGELVVYGGAALFEPVHQALLEAMGWEDGITFAEAVGSLISRFADNTIGEFVRLDHGINVEVNRYWPTGELVYLPHSDRTEPIAKAMRDVLQTEPLRRGDGTLVQPVKLEFASSFMFDMKTSYGNDPGKNRLATRMFMALREEVEHLDLYSTETVTAKTLAALGKLYAEEA